MATPTVKHPNIESALEALGGNRLAAIRGNRCVDVPIGCGKVAENFDGVLSAKEYTISGLCQTCQNEVFGTDDDDDLDVVAENCAHCECWNDHRATCCDCGMEE